MSKKKKKKKIDSNFILCIVFVLLLILVIILSIMVASKEKESKKKESANIVIPVYDENNQSSVTINAINLDKDYVIKVTNYKKNSINKKSLKYNIDVVNATSTNVVVKKGKNGSNLMTNKKETVIKDEVLQPNKKENIYYHVSVTNKNKVKDKETIVVKINS